MSCRHVLVSRRHVLYGYKTCLVWLLCLVVCAILQSYFFTRIYIHMNKRKYTHSHIRTHRDSHSNRIPFADILSHTQTREQSHTHTRTLAHTFTRTHSHSHTLLLAHTLTLTHTYSNTISPSEKLFHTHTQEHNLTRRLFLSHTYMRTCTHVHCTRYKCTWYIVRHTQTISDTVRESVGTDAIGNEETCK